MRFTLPTPTESDVSSVRGAANPCQMRMKPVIVGVTVFLSTYGVYQAAAAVTRILARGPVAQSGGVFDYPVWGLFHFVPGTLFMALGPLQLWPRLRRSHRAVHRWCGRVFIGSSIVLAVAGVVLPFTMEGRSLAEKVVMTAFFTVFLGCLIKAFWHARRHQFAAHREWMIRTFATGLVITTMRIIFLAFVITTRVEGGSREFWEHFVTSVWLAWLIHAAVAESWINITRPQSVATAPAVIGPAAFRPDLGQRNQRVWRTHG